MASTVTMTQCQPSPELLSQSISTGTRPGSDQFKDQGPLFQVSNRNKEYKPSSHPTAGTPPNNGNKSKGKPKPPRKSLSMEPHKPPATRRRVSVKRDAVAAAAIAAAIGAETTASPINTGVATTATAGGVQVHVLAASAPAPFPLAIATSATTTARSEDDTTLAIATTVAAANTTSTAARGRNAGEEITFNPYEATNNRRKHMVRALSVDTLTTAEHKEALRLLQQPQPHVHHRVRISAREPRKTTRAAELDNKCHNKHRSASAHAHQKQTNKASHMPSDQQQLHRRRGGTGRQPNRRPSKRDVHSSATKPTAADGHTNRARANSVHVHHHGDNSMHILPRKATSGDEPSRPKKHGPAVVEGSKPKKTPIAADTHKGKKKGSNDDEASPNIHGKVSPTTPRAKATLVSVNVSSPTPKAKTTLLSQELCASMNLDQLRVLDLEHLPSSTMADEEKEDPIMTRSENRYSMRRETSIKSTQQRSNYALWPFLSAASAHNVLLNNSVDSSGVNMDVIAEEQGQPRKREQPRQGAGGAPPRAFHESYSDGCQCSPQPERSALKTPPSPTSGGRGVAVLQFDSSASDGLNFFTSSSASVMTNRTGATMWSCDDSDIYSTSHASSRVIPYAIAQREPRRIGAQDYGEEKLEDVVEEPPTNSQVPPTPNFSSSGKRKTFSPSQTEMLSPYSSKVLLKGWSTDDDPLSCSLPDITCDLPKVQIRQSASHAMSSSMTQLPASILPNDSANSRKNKLRSVTHRFISPIQKKITGSKSSKVKVEPK